MSRDDVRARALLDALVAESSPTPSRTETSLRAVEARLRDEAAIAVVRPPTATPWLRAGVIAVAIAAGVLLTIAGLGAGLRAIRDDAVPGHDAASDQREHEGVQPLAPRGPELPEPPATIAAPPTKTPAAALPQPDAQLPADDRVPRRPQERVAAPTASAPNPPDLAAEVALIRAAKSQRDDLAALTVLDRHAREFPSGALARERELLRAERLCALGRVAEVRAIAAHVLADGADDPLARRMRGVCSER